MSPFPYFFISNGERESICADLIYLDEAKAGVQGSFEYLRQYTKRLVSSLPPEPPSIATTATTANGAGAGAENVNGMDQSTQSTENGTDANDAPSETASSSTTSLPSAVDTDSPSKPSPGRLRMNSIDEATREQEEEEDQAMLGCREAVEILTRLPKKGWYHYFRFRDVFGGG